MEKTEETISPEDLALLKLIKKEIKEAPKEDTAEGIKEWMLTYLSHTDEQPPKTEREVKPQPTKESKPVPKMREPPKISCFSGANLKNETTYDLWRYEVCCLMADKLFEPDNILHAVRRSLKGEAGRVAMRLGPKASIVEILEKLDSVYGDVEKKEDLLAQFYGAKQREDENVTNWSCRLEDIIGKAVMKGLVRQQEANGMLHSMLWTGLKPSLKDISGHKYDTIKDFDNLRVALRQIEKDHQERQPSASKPQTAKGATAAETTAQQSDMDELKGLVQQLSTRMDRWEQDRDRGTRQWEQTRERGPRQNTNKYRQQRQRWQDKPRQQEASTTSNTNTKEVRCYRCGQLGHIKKGCRVKMDTTSRNLNWKKPMEEGHR